VLKLDQWLYQVIMTLIDVCICCPSSVLDVQLLCQQSERSVKQSAETVRQVQRLQREAPGMHQWVVLHASV
jgi:hypothetical protein